MSDDLRMPIIKVRAPILPTIIVAAINIFPVVVNHFVMPVDIPLFENADMVSRKISMKPYVCSVINKQNDMIIIHEQASEMIASALYT